MSRFKGRTGARRCGVAVARCARLRHTPRPMPAIETHDLTKVYRTYKKAPGLWGAIKGLGRREYEDVRAADGVTLFHRGGRVRRLPRAERRGQDDGAEDALRPAQSDERLGEGARLHAVGAEGRDEAAVLAAHGAEERALVGSAGARIARAESRDLRHRAGALHDRSSAS